MGLVDVLDKLHQLHAVTNRADLTGPISAFITEQDQRLEIRRLAIVRLEASIDRLMDEIKLVEDEMVTLREQLAKPTVWRRIVEWFNHE